MTDIRFVMDAVIESEPGSAGPLALPVALVIAAPLRQWKVMVSVAPAMTDPAGVPSLELSSAAWLAIVAMAPPAGGIGEVTVTASGPLQIASAVLCWYLETAMRSDCRTELVTASR